MVLFTVLHSSHTVILQLRAVSRKKIASHSSGNNCVGPLALLFSRRPGQGRHRGAGASVKDGAAAPEAVPQWSRSAAAWSFPPYLLSLCFPLAVGYISNPQVRGNSKKCPRQWFWSFWVLSYLLSHTSCIYLLSVPSVQVGWLYFCSCRSQSGHLET